MQVWCCILHGRSFILELIAHQEHEAEMMDQHPELVKMRLSSKLEMVCLADYRTLEDMPCKHSRKVRFLLRAQTVRVQKCYQDQWLLYEIREDFEIPFEFIMNNSSSNFWPVCSDGTIAGHVTLEVFLHPHPIHIFACTLSKKKIPSAWKSLAAVIAFLFIMIVLGVWTSSRPGVLIMEIVRPLIIHTLCVFMEILPFLWVRKPSLF